MTFALAHNSSIIVYWNKQQTQNSTQQLLQRCLIETGPLCKCDTEISRYVEQNDKKGEKLALFTYFIERIIIFIDDKNKFTFILDILFFISRTLLSLSKLNHGEQQKKTGVYCQLR